MRDLPVLDYVAAALPLGAPPRRIGIEAAQPAQPQGVRPANAERCLSGTNQLDAVCRLIPAAKVRALSGMPASR